MTQAANKQVVLNALQACFGDQDVSAVDKYFSPSYIEHSPACADGLDGLRDAIKTFTSGSKIVLDVKRAAADEDLVWIHLNFPDPENEGKFLAIVDIYRVTDGKITEHWDIIQPITEEAIKNSKNSHPFF